MTSSPLLKLNTTEINPLLISRIGMIKGSRLIGTKWYRPKKGYPNYGWRHAHPLLIKKLRAVKGWRQWFLDDFHPAQWEPARVVIIGADGETLFRIICDSNDHAMEVRDKLIEQWKKVLSLYTVQGKK